MIWQVTDRDGQPLASFSQFYINFQSTSLFRWAWTFAEIRLVDPILSLRVNPQGELNIADLLAADAGDPAAPVASDPGSDLGSDSGEAATLPRLILHDVLVEGGHLLLLDQSRTTPFEQDVTPISFRLTEFSTLPEAEGPYALNMQLPGGANFTWQGTMSVAPFRSSGQIEFDSVRLETPWRYVQDQVAFAIDSGTAAGGTAYRLVAGEDLDLTLTDLSVNLDDVHLRAQTGQQRDVEMPRVALSGGRLDLRQRSFTASELRFDQTHLVSTINRDGEAELINLFVPQADDAPNDEPVSDAADDTQAESWALAIDRIVVSELTGTSRNLKVEPPAETEFTELNIELSDFNLEPGSLFGLRIDALIDGSGSLDLQGQLGISPPSLDAQLNITDLPLPPYQSYLQQAMRLDIAAGRGDFAGQLQLELDGERTDVALRGQLGVQELALQDQLAGETLLGFADLDVTGMEFVMPALALGMDQVALTGLNAALLVDEQGRLNLADAFGAGSEESASPAGQEDDAVDPGEGEAMVVTINAVTLQEGTISMIDETIDPRYRVSLDQLSGTISGLSSDNLARADVDLRAQLDGYAGFALSGQINPLAEDVYTDLVLTMDGYELTSVTPYAGKYLGQKIDQGKLSLDLKYRLSERDLVGENTILLDRFELGESVPSEDTIGLPVGLAVALLKDAQGRIDIQVPVSGNLDDPDFRIGHLVFRAVFNLITGIVTSPFKLLGSIAGGAGGGELDHVIFVPGQAALGESYLERIEALAKALQQRPQLSLEIRPAYHREVDGRALAEQLLNEQFGLDAVLIDQDAASQLQLLETTASPLLGAEAVDRLRQAAMVSVPVDGESTADPQLELDPAAFANGLWLALIDHQLVSGTISEERLRELAQDRAEQVRSRLLEVGGVDQGRVFVLEAAPAPSTEEGVKMEFELGAN